MDADANAGASTIALRERCSGELLKRAPKLKLLPILEDITCHCTSRILTFITEIFIHIFSTLVIMSISLIEATAEISKLHEVFKDKKKNYS